MQSVVARPSIIKHFLAFLTEAIGALFSTKEPFHVAYAQ